MVSRLLGLALAYASLETGFGLDGPGKAPPGWIQNCWEEDNSAASTGRSPSGHGAWARAGKGSTDIYSLPGKGECKAKIGPG